ncbi:MAG: hypothetical protein EOO43_04660 [Flavobacterium sp.]|nr:MAG: hypothetical protein EOO43_04660 [Flavobacterium sp.]
MKKQSPKLLVFILFASLFIIASCEKVDDHDRHSHEGIQAFEKVNLNQIPLFERKFRSDSDIYKSKISFNKSGNDTINYFDLIVPENINSELYDQTNNLHYYTFALNLKENNRLTNLVVKETLEGNEYYVFIFKSKHVDAWVQSLTDYSPNGNVDIETEIFKIELEDSYSDKIKRSCWTGVTSWRCPFDAHTIGEGNWLSCETFKAGGGGLSGWTSSISYMEIPCAEDGGGSSSGSGSGSGSGGSGGGVGGSGTSGPNSPTPINVQPNAPSKLFLFAESLTGDVKIWWSLNSINKIPMMTFLTKHNHSVESEKYVIDLIIYALLNNNSPEAVQEIKNILDILDDGLLGGQPVIVGPDLPINNMAEYLSIFNTSQPATITLYADQPKTGTHNLTSTTERVGHTFISIKQGTKVRSLGFYPQSTAESITPNPFTLDPNDFMSTTGSFGNDQGHKFDVSISKSITPTQLSNIISEIIVIVQNNLPYNLSTMNCTDLGIIIFENATNINIPSAESTRVYWDGQSPGTLGEVLRTIPLSSGTTKNVIGGNAPLNSSN